MPARPRTDVQASPKGQSQRGDGEEELEAGLVDLDPVRRPEGAQQQGG